jgi:hypothetical protein
LAAGGAKVFKDWYNLMMLAAESQTVIALRLMRVSQGGRAAGAEASRMVTEKIAAAGEATATLVAGGNMDKVVKGYRRRVRKNVRRLARG